MRIASNVHFPAKNCVTLWILTTRDLHFDFDCANVLLSLRATCLSFACATCGTRCGRPRPKIDFRENWSGVHVIYPPLQPSRG
jgi:hypothetical protein